MNKRGSIHPGGVGPDFTGVVNRHAHHMVYLSGRIIGRFPATLYGRYLAEKCLANPQETALTKAQRQLDQLIPSTGREFRYFDEF